MRQLGHAYDFANPMTAFDLLVIEDIGLMELGMYRGCDLIETIDCKKQQ